MVTRIVIIEGSQGAGKTTIINLLAKAICNSGKTVALITNDHGEASVDTQLCTAQGHKVAEVLKGCYHCRFDDLMPSARSLGGRSAPDIILVEPIGSSMDLLATVIAPLRVLYPHELTMAQLITLVDAERAVEAGFDPERIGEYLHRHQVQDAEVVVISKMDLVTGEELEQVRDIIGELNPQANTVPYSSVTGRGLDQIIDIIGSDRVSHRTPVQVDHEVFAKAEAELGWYNGVYRFHADKADSYDLATRVLRGIAAQYPPDDIAYAKVLLRSESNMVKMCITLRDLNVDAVQGSRYSDGGINMMVDARIISSPEELRGVVRSSVQKAMEQTGLSLEGFEDDCFSPSRPDPAHRSV